MLWNWYTIDACFLFRGWHITSGGGMAASCIGVMLLTVCLEALRRLGKEYDAFLSRKFNAEAAVIAKTTGNSGDDTAESSCALQVITCRASLLQQLARALIHAVTFGVAYIIMLLAMYFNGFIIFSIFVGAGIGKFLCDWLVIKVTVGSPCTAQNGQNTNEHEIEEPTVCCG